MEEENKTLFAGDMIACKENPKESMKKFKNEHVSSARLQDTGSTYEKQFYCYILEIHM